jgi:hypothetical protein
MKMKNGILEHRSLEILRLVGRTVSVRRSALIPALTGKTRDRSGNSGLAVSIRWCPQGLSASIREIQRFTVVTLLTFLTIQRLSISGKIVWNCSLKRFMLPHVLFRARNGWPLLTQPFLPVQLFPTKSNL